MTTTHAASRPADLDATALRLLQLMNESIGQSMTIERLMDDVRYNISKTRCIVGHSSVYTAHIETLELQPTIRLDVSPSGELTMKQVEEDADDECNTAARQFRPFGPLEPQTARQTRALMHDVVQRLCELANTRTRLLQLGMQYQFCALNFPVSLMQCQIRPFISLSSDQITSISSFLLQGQHASNENRKDGEDDHDFLTSDEEDEEEGDVAEKRANVEDWNNWGEVTSAPVIRRRGSSNRENSRWLNSTLVSASMDMETMVVAMVQRFVVLRRSASQSHAMEIAAQVRVQHGDVSSDWISALLVLPIASHRITETTSSDWTAIIIGFSTGHALFYTERGVLIFIEHFFANPITAIRIGMSLFPGNQEIAMQASNEMVVVEGLSLYTALKGARSQIARGEFTVEQLSELVQLNCRRFEIDCAEIADCAVSGPLKPSAFDQYSTASISDMGFHARIERTSLPVYSTYLVTGSRPYLLFAWHDDSQSSFAVISDAVYNLASQLKTSVTSQLPSFGLRAYFGIGKSEKKSKKTSPAHMRAVRIPSRSTMSDGGRDGERMVKAPTPWRLAVVCDAQARIALVQTETRCILRMWKGYRDARCAWIETRGGGRASDTSTANSRALFLVIFAPRRGLLEIWAMQNGPRVAAFNVDRRGRLLNIGRSRDALLAPSSSSTDSSFGLDADVANTAIFITSEGEMQNIVVPFHLALQDDSAASIHDENLMKQICAMTKCADELDVEKWLRLVTSARTMSAKRTALESLLDRPFTSVLTLDAIVNRLRSNCLISSSASNSTSTTMSPEGRSLLAYVDGVTQLLHAYAAVYELHLSPAGKVSSIEQDDKRAISIAMRLPMDQLSTVLDCLQECASESASRADFSLEIRTLLQLFDPVSAEEVEASKGDRLWLRQTLKQFSPQLGHFLFLPVLTARCDLTEYMENILPQFGLTQMELWRLFCAFWLDATSAAQRPTFSLVLVLRVVQALMWHTGEQLQFIIDSLLDSTEMELALSLCLLVRATVLNSKTEKDDDDDEDDTKEKEMKDDGKKWEPVSMGHELWDLMLTHLQCCAVIRRLPQAPVICMRQLLEQGRGFYRETIGVWASRYHPDIARLRSVLHGEDSARSRPDDWPVWGDCLAQLLVILPFSLRTELVFADCAWECVSVWQRDVEHRIVHLQTAIAYLEQLNSCPKLQHGLILKLWDTFVHERLKALVTLVQKVGRFPKDRETRKDVGVGETELIAFVQCCHRLLGMLSDAVRDLEYDESLTHRYEDCLHHLFDLDLIAIDTRNRWRLREPLTEIAMRQQSVNYHLVLHHMHLVVLLELQLSTSARMRPLEFFDEKGRRAFFEPLHSHPLIPLDDVAESLRDRRLAFLLLAMKSVTTNVAGENERRRVWQLAIGLAHDWRLDVDRLRIQEIVGFYEDGNDEAAERGMVAVQNRVQLVQQLLPIVAAQLRAMLVRGERFEELERNSIVRPSTIDYLRATASVDLPSPPVSDCSVDRIRRRLRQLNTFAVTSAIGDSSRFVIADLDKIASLFFPSS